MGDKPPKPPPDDKNDVLGALEEALLEARQRVAEAVDGLRAVIRGRQAGKLSNDTGRYTRAPKGRSASPEHRKRKAK